MASNLYTVDMLMNINTANVNADVNVNEYIVTLFNRYANRVPVDEYNRLWDEQNSGNHVFGEMQNGQLPDWAIMIMKITFWKLFNNSNDYTWELLSTEALGNEDRQKQYAMSFIKWWWEHSIKPKPFKPHRQVRAPARTQEHAGAWMLT